MEKSKVTLRKERRYIRMTLNDVAHTLSQKKKCQVTLYDKVGYIVIIQYKKRKKQRNESLLCSDYAKCRVTIVISL